MPIISIEPAEGTPGYKFEVSVTELAKLRTYVRMPAPRTRAVLEERIGRTFTAAQVLAAEDAYRASQRQSAVPVKTTPRRAVSSFRVPSRRATGRRPASARLPATNGTW